MARKNKLSDAEIEELLSKPFEIFPEPSAEAKALGVTARGPLEWQQSLFWWMFPWEQRLANLNNTHACNKTNDLVYSGSGLGKTQIGVSLNALFLTAFPGCNTVTGADKYSDVEQIIIPKLRDLFSVNAPWDHPFVHHVPNKQDKYLELRVPTLEKGKVVYKASRAWLTHFSDWERLRGKEYVYAHLEEISQLKEPRVVDEIDRRLRSPIAPVRMMYATTNPPESMSHFLYDKWDLHEYMEDFDGEPPQPKLCRCHLCPKCDESNLGDYPFDSMGYCSNPNCAWIEVAIANKLPVKPFKKPLNTIDGVDYPCPGNQPSWRVYRPKPGSNLHNPATMGQQLKVGHDASNYAVYVQGDVRALTSDKVYYNYSYAGHSIPKPEVDPSRDIYWAHDHNLRPRASVIIQEYHNPDSLIPDVLVIDEIVRYEARVTRYDDDTKERLKGCGPEDVAQDFIDRYSEWNKASIAYGKQKTVYIHGDHTAWNRGANSSGLSKNAFQIMRDMLKAAGFKVVLAVVKKNKVKIQINVKDRLELTNYMLSDWNRVRHIYVSKSAYHLHKSLSDLEKKNNDKEDIDKSCDELARRSTNPNAVHLISHISDALGYYLARKFNLIKDNSGEFQFVYIPNEAILSIGADGKITKQKDRNKEEEKPRRQSSTDIISMIRDITGADDWSDIGKFSDYFGW